MLGLRGTATERIETMQALYENTDGSYSVGVVVGHGVSRHGMGTVQVRFEDTDTQNGGAVRVETLEATDRYLTLGILYGSMVSALKKHA